VTARWELLRALGALTVLTPPTGDAIVDALELPVWQPADHTRLFILELPPYASIHLGAEGKLGGEGADRVAGIWRALGLDPPSDADHLAAILALYAELGDAADSCATAAARSRLDHARTTVLWEHLLSWVPGYLAALGDDPAAAPWARLTREALRREASLSPPATRLAAALRDAPDPLHPDIGYDELLDALVVPVRTGYVLTYDDLSRAASRLGVGLRRGERRFALDAMLGQSPAPTLEWLAGHARRWSHLHEQGSWWARRAAGTACTLDSLARCQAR